MKRAFDKSTGELVFVEIRTASPMVKVTYLREVKFKNNKVKMPMLVNKHLFDRLYEVL